MEGEEIKKQAIILCTIASLIFGLALFVPSIASAGTVTGNITLRGKSLNYTLPDSPKLTITVHKIENGEKNMGAATHNPSTSTYTTKPLKDGVYRIKVEENLDPAAWKEILTKGVVGYIIDTDTWVVGEANFKLAGGRVVWGSTDLRVEVSESGSLLDAAFLTAMKGSINTVLMNIRFAVRIMTRWINEVLILGNDVELKAGVENVWRVTRNMTLSILTLGLLIVAFANILSIPIESYGLNRFIPKLIIAIGMTMSSHLIASFLLDMMSALQQLLFTATGTVNSFNLDLTSRFNPSMSDFSNQIGQLIFLCLIGWSIVFAMLWLCLILIVRNVMLYVLVGIAPIAFMANILPFTEQYYKQWWKSFWQWAFIGPAVSVMLWITTEFMNSGFYNTTFNNIDPDSTEGWIWLITVAVLLFMTALLPFKMGKEVYGGIQDAWKKHGSKIPGVKYGKEWMAQSKAPGEQRRKLAVSRARTQLALKNQDKASGGILRALTGARKSDIPRLENDYIKDKVASLDNLTFAQKRAMFDDWDSMTGLDRRALVRSAAGSKAIPDDGATLQKVFSDENIWLKDQEAAGKILKEQPGLISKAMMGGHVDTETTDADGNLPALENQIKTMHNISMNKSPSEMVPEQIQWMAAKDMNRLEKILTNKQAVMDIRLKDNPKLQKEIAKQVVANPELRRRIGTIADEDHRNALAGIMSHHEPTEPVRT